METTATPTQFSRESLNKARWLTLHLAPRTNYIDATAFGYSHMGLYRVLRTKGRSPYIFLGTECRVRMSKTFVHHLGISDEKLTALVILSFFQMSPCIQYPNRIFVQSIASLFLLTSLGVETRKSASCLSAVILPSSLALPAKILLSIHNVGLWKQRYERILARTLKTSRTRQQWRGLSDP